MKEHLWIGKHLVVVLCFYAAVAFFGIGIYQLATSYDETFMLAMIGLIVLAGSCALLLDKP